MELREQFADRHCDHRAGEVEKERAFGGNNIAEIADLLFECGHRQRSLE